MLLTDSHFYKTLLESTLAIPWQIDWKTKQFIYIGPQIEKLLGWKQASWVSAQDWIDRIHPEEREAVASYCISQSEKGSDHEADYRALKADGTWVWVRDVVHVVRHKGETTHLIGFMFDISARKEIEMQIVAAKQETEAALDSKATFLAYMSHEIRSPLNVIIGFSKLGLEESRPEKLNDYLNRVYTSSLHLLGIINNILDFSKIDANKLELEMRHFHLGDLIVEIQKEMELFSSRKELTLKFMLSLDLPEYLYGDALRIKQVLINLISNAIKFTRQGEVICSIKLLSHSDDMLNIHFSISDTGIGLSPEQQEKLFQPYSQVDSSTAREFGGTGLGLNICKQLVELMGGQITVESELDQGSTFSFSILCERK